MSDCFIEIVPKDPFLLLPGTLLEEARANLASRIKCDSVTVECYDTPEFINCLSNLERILCPLCGSEIDFDWWSDAMDTASESGFTDLDTETPCCHKTVSLNDLNYDFPCAFARCVIIITNPVDDLPEDAEKRVREILGTQTRTVRAHL